MKPNLAIDGLDIRTFLLRRPSRTRMDGTENSWAPLVLPFLGEPQQSDDEANPIFWGYILLGCEDDQLKLKSLFLPGKYIYQN